MVNRTKLLNDLEKNNFNRFKSFTSPFKASARRNLAKILENVRTGPETLIVVPPIARGGNWLYEWLRADQISQENKALAFLTYREDMNPWLDEFPMLKNLTKDKNFVKFKTKRIIGAHQDIYKHFSEKELDNFIEKYLLSPSFVNRQENSKKYVTPETLVINVRRGDYYSNKTVHYDFGIHTIEYIKLSLHLALKNLTPSNIIVVSDDLNWCARNLKFLTRIAPTSFEKIGSGMFDDLATLSVAHHLILTNTTFGYWGAYIANRSENCFVYAPNIHQRGVNSHPAPQQHKKNWIQVHPPENLDSWLEEE